MPVLSPSISVDINVIYKLCLALTRGYYCCGDPKYIVDKCLAKLNIQQSTAKQQKTSKRFKHINKN